MIVAKVAGLAALALVACAGVFGPSDEIRPGDEAEMLLSYGGGVTLVIPVKRIDPPETYRRWHHQMELCSGRQADGFDGIEWYVTPNTWRNPVNPQLFTYGIYIEGKRQIVLAFPLMHDSTLVTHESLHDVLYRSGWRAKPSGPIRPSTGKPTYTKGDLHPSPPYGFCAPA